MPHSSFSRILLKLSGEIFSGTKGFGIDPEITYELAKKIIQISNKSIEVGIVIGGGNIIRGISSEAKGLDRVPGDYLGMMATIMNSVALQSALEKLGSDTRVMSALSITQLAEPYIRRRGIRHLEKGRIVIFAGGTGNPYFTTDTAAALRATELKANVLLKATKVDGVYDKDPVENSDALKFDQITFQDILEQNIRVMDLTAITLCKENNLPIRIFNINNNGDLKKIVLGSNIGTIVKD